MAANSAGLPPSSTVLFVLDFEAATSNNTATLAVATILIILLFIVFSPFKQFHPTPRTEQFLCQGSRDGWF